MKYISIISVLDAYNGCKGKTQNKFWGLLAILRAINKPIIPAISYTFQTSEVSQILDSLFSFNDGTKDNRRGDVWSVLFSKKWLKVIPEIMYDKTPNIVDVAVWFFRKEAFPDDFDVNKLVSKFLDTFYFSKDDAQYLFDTSIKDVVFSNLPYLDNELLSGICLDEPIPDTNKLSISFENTKFLKSNAGNLGQAAFVQTLYSAQSPQKCLIITQFDFNKEYSKDNQNNTIMNKDKSLQQIFYGAPGTGKSHIIKDDDNVKESDNKNLVFRTTFHPDSDYSTFVGAYKPTMRPVADKYKAVAGKDEEISYSFVPQAFLQAYVAAWNNPDDKVFLVIEEINRGNCAQIFGDLFQLLDRDGEGFSEYPIKADRDIANYLKGKDEFGQDILINKDGIKEGKLKLPSNLYIWATMNTSDQSLFPIDSAFKRRWDWVYMPIADAKKNYIIEIDNDQYDWWSFLEAINTIIESTTHSEDKKLGYFFVKTKDDRITAETFVGKVIFYLWNDVFKDNETNHKAFKDSNGDLLAFHKFFHNDGTVDTNVVIKFLQDLEVYPFEISDDGTTTVSTATPNTKRQRDKSRYRVNGTDNLNKAQMTREAFRLYIDAHPDADAQAIARAWNGLGLKDYVRHLVETEDEYNARTQDSSDPNKRATEFELSNGEKIYLSTQFGIGNIGKFMDAVNNAGWNIRIENQA